jgi:hypothetical protein
VDPVDALTGRVREHTVAYMAGGPRSFDAFRNLVQLLLDLTVLADGQYVRLVRQTGRERVGALGGPTGPTEPVQLRNGYWLRVAVDLYLAPHEGGTRLKVRKSSYQYQADRDGEREVFRFDYLREPGDRPHPTAHLNVHGTLDVNDALPADTTLARVHFPTDRVSLEAVIRLLAQDFAVPCARPPEVWRPVLAASEAAFREIAHRPGA